QDEGGGRRRQAGVTDVGDGFGWWAGTPGAPWRWPTPGAWPSQVRSRVGVSPPSRTSHAIPGSRRGASLRLTPQGEEQISLPVEARRRWLARELTSFRPNRSPNLPASTVATVSVSR